MKKILIIRFSALGDVAMLVPVVKRLLAEQPELEVTILSRKQVEPLWTDMPERVHFFGADLKGRHKGWLGMHRLLADLNYRQFDAVADMHRVLRSKIIRNAMFFAGIPVYTIQKGRWRKRLCVHQDLWISKLVLKLFPDFLPNPLPSTISRYEDVLRAMGLLSKGEGSYSFENGKRIRHDIGIAPFAAHKGKIYPLDKMQEVVRLLSEQISEKGEKIYLFGAGIKEKAVLEKWEAQYPGVVSLAGKETMDKEIEMMRGLRLMVTMDSSNMHFASLAETRVVSIWGATHPKVGFLGYGQKMEDCIQQELPCRPCSVYGNKPCQFGDYHCFDMKPEVVVQKILERL